MKKAANYNRISEAELKDFEEAFNLYDENNDGHITTTELSTVLKKLGQNPSEQQIADFIKECDTDKNGTIDFLEFCRYLVNFRRKLFESIDTDDSGYITPEQVQVLFEKMGVEDVSLDDAKSFVAEGDTDQDGKLSYKEFVKILHAHPVI